MTRLQGCGTALVTPFTESGQVDFPALRALVDWQIAEGIDFLVACGSTGEAQTLDDSERERVVAAVVEVAAGRVPVMAGATSNDTSRAVDETERMCRLGADYILSATPYYNKPTQDGLLEHYRLIAKAHPGFPIVAYNVPGRTSVDLLAETCQRLCDIKELVAIKEATASMPRAIELIERCGARLTLLSGDDFTVLPFIASGGKGVISVSANVAPRLIADLVKASLAGDLKKALELQVKLNNLHRLLFVESNPIPVKWALHLMKRFGPDIRPPLTPMTPANAAKLKEELGKLGLLS
jgi:4-hydroxy-tetrahydrodipicolinate synthase